MMPEELEVRRRRALAGLDAVIDVLSAWRGRYEDDDRPANIAWIVAVIPQTQADPQRGWLCVGDTAVPGIGWEIRDGAFHFRSLDRSPWPATRRRFREIARANGVRLPACHATLYLDG